MRLRAHLAAITLGAGFVASIVPGCGADNALVDGECAAGYVACDGACVDPLSDPAHCGGCGRACASGVACGAGVCGNDACGAGVCGNDAAADGSADGSRDSATDGLVETGTDGSIEAGDACPPPPHVTPSACGACGIVCVAPTGACRPDGGGNYVCAAPCIAPLVACGPTCVDLTLDPRNCGTCGKTCPSNICSASTCQGGTPGDVVVIGHDYQDALAGSSQARVLTNAVFIPSSNPLRILSFEQFTDPAVVANVKSLIQSAAGGRTLKLTVATNPAALASPILAQLYDVVLLPDQQGGAPATLATTGATWSNDLSTFAKAGGVIVALDGNAGQGGMPSLLSAALLLDLAGHQTIPASSLVSIVAPADRIATLVVSPYATFDRSVTFQSNEPNGGNVVYVAEQIVGGVPVDPVVVHKVIP